MRLSIAFDGPHSGALDLQFDTMVLVKVADLTEFEPLLISATVLVSTAIPTQATVDQFKDLNVCGMRLVRLLLVVAFLVGQQDVPADLTTRDVRLDMVVVGLLQAQDDLAAERTHAILSV